MELNEIRLVLGIILVLLGIWDVIRGEFSLAVLTGIIGILILLNYALSKKVQKIKR